MSRAFVAASTQYLELDAALISNVPATLACWFNSDTITATQALLALVDKDDDNDRLILFAAGATAGDPVLAQTTNLTGASSVATTSTGYSANTWHHAAGVFAANNDRRAFIDGGSKGTDTTTRTMTGGQIDRVSIGRNGSLTAGSYMSGRIAEAALWSVALSDVEIAALASRVSPRRIRPESLLAYWPLWGLHSPEIDLGTNNRQLTVTGATLANHAPVTRLIRPGLGVLPAAAPAGGVATHMNHLRRLRAA